MKRGFLVVIMLVFCVVAFAQKLSTSRVPANVRESFKKAHPSATASWEREDAAYEANFEEEGKIMSCVIDKQGTILETESSITFNELPADAKSYVTQHYKGKKIKEVAKIDKAGGGVAYEVNVQGKDILFDSNGARMEKPKEKNEKD